MEPILTPLEPILTPLQFSTDNGVITPRSLFIKLHNTLRGKNRDEIMTLINSGDNFNAKYRGKPIFFVIFEYLNDKYNSNVGTVEVNALYEMVVQLTKVGLNFKLTDEDGYSVLHHSAYNDLWVVAAVLLKLDLCDVNARSNANLTPLHLCLRKRELDMTTIVVLMASGADILLKDDNELTPLEFRYENETNFVPNAMWVVTLFFQLSRDSQLTKRGYLTQLLRDTNNLCNKIPSSTSDGCSNCDNNYLYRSRSFNKTSEVKRQFAQGIREQAFENSQKLTLSDDNASDSIIGAVYDMFYRPHTNSECVRLYGYSRKWLGIARKEFTLSPTEKELEDRDKFYEEIWQEKRRRKFGPIDRALVDEYEFLQQKKYERHKDLLSLHHDWKKNSKMNEKLCDAKDNDTLFLSVLGHKYFIRGSTVDIVYDLTGIADCTPQISDSEWLRRMSPDYDFGEDMSGYNILRTDIMHPIQKSYLYVLLLSGRFEVMLELLKMRDFDILPMSLVIIICLQNIRNKFVFPKKSQEIIHSTIQKCEEVCRQIVTEILSERDRDAHNFCDFLAFPIPHYGGNSIYELVIKAQCPALIDLEVFKTLRDMQWLCWLRTMSMPRRVFAIMCPYGQILTRYWYYKHGGRIEMTHNDCSISFQEVISYPISKYVYHVVAHVFFLLMMTYSLVITFNDVISIVDVFTVSYVLGYMLDEAVEFFWYYKNSRFGYFKDAWNIIDVGGILFFILGFIVRVLAISTRNVNSQEQVDDLFYTARVVSVISLLLFFLRTLYYFQMLTYIGPKITMISRMAKNDLLPLLSIFFVVLLSFGIAAEVLLYPYTPNTDKNVASFLTTIIKVLVKSFYTMISADYLLNDFEEEICNQTTCPDKRGILFVKNGILIVYIIIANILLLNLLIAVFSNTISEVEAQARQYWVTRRHYIVQQISRKGFPPPFNILWYGVHVGRLRCLRAFFAAKTTAIVSDPRDFKSEHSYVSFLFDTYNTIIDMQAKLQPNDVTQQSSNKDDWLKTYKNATPFTFLFRQASVLRNLRLGLFEHLQRPTT